MAEAQAAATHAGADARSPHRQNTSDSDLWEDSLAYYAQDDLEVNGVEDLRPPNTGESAKLLIQ